MHTFDTSVFGLAGVDKELIWLRFTPIWEDRWLLTSCTDMIVTLYSLWSIMWLALIRHLRTPFCLV